MCYNLSFYPLSWKPGFQRSNRFCWVSLLFYAGFWFFFQCSYNYCVTLPVIDHHYPVIVTQEAHMVSRLHFWSRPVHSCLLNACLWFVSFALELKREWVSEREGKERGHRSEKKMLIQMLIVALLEADISSVYVQGSSSAYRFHSIKVKSFTCLST